MEPRIHTLNLTQTGGPEPLVRECLYAAIPHDFNYVQAAPGVHKDPHPYGAGDAIMIVLAGSMDLIVDGSKYPLAAGQMAVIPNGALRGFTAGPEGMTMIACHLRAS